MKGVIQIHWDWEAVPASNIFFNSLVTCDPLMSLITSGFAPGLGMSILEMGHRDAGGPVQQVLQEARNGMGMGWEWDNYM